MDVMQESGHLYLQCPTGISGDMFLGAMADMGLEVQALGPILAQAGVGVDLGVRKLCKCGLQGTAVQVQARHPSPPLRTLKDIHPLIQACPMSDEVKSRTGQAFERLAQVEAQVHGVAVSQVHFHEVGAVDTLVDIVGCFWALESLGIHSVSCSALPWFQGWVHCAHGLLPLPAPATILLLLEKPVTPTDFEQELVTPTGALIVDQIVSGFGPPPAGTLIRSGTGWGQADLGQTPNGLRTFCFQSSPEKDGLQVEQLWLLESNLDHLTGEEVGAVYAPLFAAGALDVLYLPGVMKKNRPGGQLQVLCSVQDLDRVQACFLEQTMTLGLRRRMVERVVLQRDKRTVLTEMGSVQAKTVTWKGETWTRPEHEALLDLAQKTGRSVTQLRFLLQGLDVSKE